MSGSAAEQQEEFISAGQKVFEIEARALQSVGARLDVHFFRAIDGILKSSGRVILCGMGKSGIIAHKIAATLASTGTPSFFMHPGEAYHGDLGMVTKEDVFIAISNSGETEEVVKLISFLQDNGNFLIAMTGNPQSTLAKAAQCHLNVTVEEEACPLQLAPTSSTTATLAMGDALAVVLMKARNFQPEHFARFHPGGSLGRRLLRKVEDEMVKKNLPFVNEQDSFTRVIDIMSGGMLGLVIVRREQGLGLITDGDIRRALDKYEKHVFEKTAGYLMHKDPLCVPVGTRVSDALSLMDHKHITSLLVQVSGEVVGVFKK